MTNLSYYYLNGKVVHVDSMEPVESDQGEVDAREEKYNKPTLRLIIT